MNIDSQKYRVFFVAALILHAMLALVLAWSPKHDNTPSVAMTMTQKQPVPEPQSIQAVSVDAADLTAAVDLLKAAAAEARQRLALRNEAEALRRQRAQEQQHVRALKEEAMKLAAAQKKRELNEQHQLQKLALQKEQQMQQLQALENKRKQLEKQQQEQQEAARAEQLRLKKMEDEARVARAAEAAAKQARVAGVVDKYKALIIHAIGEQWILPEQVDHNLSSQFRIHLGPHGVVLDVQLTRSSGSSVLDRSAQAAIYKASPLPVPSEPDLFNLFRDISLTVRPEHVMS